MRGTGAQAQIGLNTEAAMSQISSHLVADLGLNALRAGDIFSAFLAGVEQVRERREVRRAAGVDRVTELAIRYREALAGETAATDAARALADENARLKAELAASRRATAAQKARADRAETAILAHARRIRVA